MTKSRSAGKRGNEAGQRKTLYGFSHQLLYYSCYSLLTITLYTTACFRMRESCDSLEDVEPGFAGNSFAAVYWIWGDASRNVSHIN